MKVTKSISNPTRKLVAVIGMGGRGIFLPLRSGSIFITEAGRGEGYRVVSLEECFHQAPGRTPVYEGETVTLQF